MAEPYSVSTILFGILQFHKQPLSEMTSVEACGRAGLEAARAQRPSGPKSRNQSSDAAPRAVYNEIISPAAPSNPARERRAVEGQQTPTHSAFMCKYTRLSLRTSSCGSASAFRLSAFGCPCAGIGVCILCTYGVLTVK